MFRLFTSSGRRHSAIRRNVLPFLAGGIPSGWLIRQRPPVVIHPFYHTVSDEYLPHIHPLYRPLGRRAFEWDLDFLSRRFEAVTAGEVYRSPDNPGSRTRHAFHLSFDDGLRGVYENALPLLLRKGIPATIFINSDFTDNRQLFYRHKTALLTDKLDRTSEAVQNEAKNRIRRALQTNVRSLRAAIHALPHFRQDLLDELACLLEVDFGEYLKTRRPYLATDELREMQRKGFTIGAHSINHLPFPLLDGKEQLRQTLESCAFVRDTFREPVAYFSFPFSENGIPASFFDAIAGKVDLCFGTSGINSRYGGRLLGRIDMEQNGRNAREAIHKAFLRTQRLSRFCIFGKQSPCA